MKREYKVRGKVITINELEGVRAIKPTFRTNEVFKNIQNTFDSNSRQLFKDLQGEIPSGKEQLTAFSNAGWVFVKPNHVSLSNLDNRNFSLPEIEQSNRVFNDEDGNVMIATNRINLKLHPDIGPSQVGEFFKRHSLLFVREQGYAPNLFEVSTENPDVIAEVNKLSAFPEVVYAEVQMLMHLPQRFKPNDPLYVKQWHHNNDGSNGTVPGADIKSELAWNISRGKGIKIAVIDNGFEVTHPDLAPAVHPHSGYFTRSGGGYLFKKGTVGFPNNDHGTFCAGMAVARENNGSGGCGVAHQSDFMAIACLPDQVDTQTTLARAIAYAANPSLEIPATPSGMGADIITCSLGPNDAAWRMESVLEDAIVFAVEHGRGGKGCCIFWAVSNGNFPINSPGNADEVSAFDATISVGRSGSDDREHGSAFGPELDFLAPGVQVFSTTNGGRFGYNTGTSFAAPLAAGCAAVLLSKNPNLTWQAIRDILRSSCDKVGNVSYDANGHHPKYGFGRINIFQALKLA